MTAILLGIVVAYLTILISVAIAIFSEKKEFETLDRNVILDHIIKAKFLLLYLSFSTIPLLFWNGSSLWARLIEIAFWIVGIFCFTKILIGAYQWMKGNKFRLRFDYLQRLTVKQDLEETWRSVWQTENINLQNEKKFFNIFHDTLNLLFLKEKEDDLVIASKLLGDFDSFIDKRDDAFFVWSDQPLDSFLDWHFELWKKQQQCAGQKEKIDKNILYYDLFRTMGSIFQKIETKAFKGAMSYSFFKKLKIHAEKHSITTEPSQLYLKALFRSFYKIFFQIIHDAPEKFDIWEHYFPKEWMITKSNLQSTENTIPLISYNIFQKWAAQRIANPRKENDDQLEDISSNLFPDVDPILWAQILIFLFSPYGENRIRSVIEKKWTFGFIGRIKVFSYNGQHDDQFKEMIDDDLKNTFDLSYYLFKNQFCVSSLENHIESLEQLSYPEDSEEAKKKQKLHSLFTKMLEYSKDSNLLNSVQ